MSGRIRLRDDGALYVSGAVGPADCEALRRAADVHLRGTAGGRVFGDGHLARVLGPSGSVGRHAVAVLGAAAQPVRAVIFDKTPDLNWAVPWHQDRTIAVRQRREVHGFGPWTVKAGVAHVEPPFDILAGMVTLRVHLDACGPDNGPLQVALGSHRAGRVLASDAASLAARSPVVSCLATAGDIWLYATPIVHASAAAGRPCRRRVLHVDYAATDLPGGLEWMGIRDPVAEAAPGRQPSTGSRGCGGLLAGLRAPQALVSRKLG